MIWKDTLAGFCLAFAISVLIPDPARVGDRLAVYVLLFAALQLVKWSAVDAAR